MSAEQLKFHPVAAMFPLLRDLDVNRWIEFVGSVREELLEPIIVHEGTILDGRNRYLACLEVKREPRFVEFASLGLDISPHEYAFQRNFVRRNLTEDQRTAIATQFWEFDRDLARQRSKQNLKRGSRKPEVTDRSPREKQAKTREKVAQTAEVSERKAQQAINVQRDAPELLPKVASGEMKLVDAVKKTTPVKKETTAEDPLRYRASDPVAKIMRLIKKLTPLERRELRSHFDAFEKLMDRKQPEQIDGTASGAVLQ